MSDEWRNEGQATDIFSPSRALVIQCLADLMLKDALTKTRYINENCRDEMKFELLQRVSRTLSLSLVVVITPPSDALG